MDTKAHKTYKRLDNRFVFQVMTSMNFIFLGLLLYYAMFLYYTCIL